PQLVDHAPVHLRPASFYTRRIGRPVNGSGPVRSAHRETHRLAARLNSLVYARPDLLHVRLGVDLIPQARLGLGCDFFNRLARTAADDHYAFSRGGPTRRRQFAFGMVLVLIG